MGETLRVRQKFTVPSPGRIAENEEADEIARMACDDFSAIC